MRTTILVILFLLVGVCGYAWKTNPDGCKKLGTDLIAVFQPQTDSQSAPSGDTVPAPVNLPPPKPHHDAWVSHPTALQLWQPPANVPAQPNWTWTTTDGNTYQNVVIEKINADTVSIVHSAGVAHVPIATLPADIQKQLNYDPAAAAIAKNESAREDAHPYYTMPELADAKAAALQLNWPIAWICSDTAYMNQASPVPGSEADLTQMEINYLKSRAVIVFLNGNDDLGKVNSVVREQQFFQMDDGPIPGGHHFYAPKVVFTDPDVSQALGRVSHTDVVAAREAAVGAVIDPLAAEMATPVPSAQAH